jgi:hypothetical protein
VFQRLYKISADKNILGLLPRILRYRLCALQAPPEVASQNIFIRTYFVQALSLLLSSGK